MTASQEPALRARFLSAQGRFFVAGLIAIRIVAWLIVLALPSESPTASVIDTIGGLALLIALAILLYRVILIGTRRFLWRVRRKLILSYMFIGVVPALLIVAFFLLCGLLVFINVSSYLVKSDLRDVSEEGRFIAESSAAEVSRAGLENAHAVLLRRQQMLVRRYPLISLTLVPTGTPPCAGGSAGSRGASQRPPFDAVVVGPWQHAAPPRELPAWVACSGFSGIVRDEDLPAKAGSHEARSGSRGETSGSQTPLIVRAVALPDGPAPRFAVIADIPVDSDLRRAVRLRTGITIGDVVAQADRAAGGSAGRVAFLDTTVWDDGALASTTVEIETSLAEMYDRLSSTTLRAGQNVGQLLAVAVLVVGVLFLIIEIVALVMGLALARSITGSVHELFEGTERVQHGDLTYKIPITARDQLGELAASFNSMTASIKNLLREA
ncbi:MAG: HAMP domain-containing protein [Acidobacteria bacterium]|nr:HAMP domain-containing protein [Acidobacteriota bacterium]